MNPPSNTSPRAKIGPWILLLLSLFWIVAVRVPLILNAETHLDSDLAVDGLTLRDTIAGHWRWHYPGTPYIGTLPVLFSLPQALIWGVDSLSLVSGGTLAYAVLVVLTFLLAKRAFGPETAAWCLVPLTFASTGTLWLSGRVTGGHLTAAAWHAGAFALLHTNLSRSRLREAIALGLWCGLGLWVDSLFLVSLAGLIPASLASWWISGRSRRGIVHGLVIVVAFLVGLLPCEIGRRVDPYDAYQEQFRPIYQREVLTEHARILTLDCLPRLIVGHRLFGLQADPSPSALSSSAPVESKPDLHPLAIGVTLVGLAFFVVGLVNLALPGPGSPPIATRAVTFGLLLSAIATLAGFVLNRNIFNSDNYRYLVGFLVPGSLGIGLTLRRLSRAGGGGRWIAGIGALAFALLMTADTARWYTRFGWVDDSGRPTRRALNDRALAWLNTHPEVGEFLGGYWDVYRLSFLASHPVRGIPYPVYPNRFPGDGQREKDGHPGIVLVRPSAAEAQFFLNRALRDGGRILSRERGFLIVAWP